MSLCPICNAELVCSLPNSFFVCKKCKVAVREEKYMPLKQEDIFDKQWAAGEENKILNHKIASFRARQIKKIKGIKNILDCGCGTGILVDLLEKKGFIVDGVDSSAANIDYARLNKAGNYYIQDIQKVDTGRKYDLIVASHLIEHLRSPEQFIKNLKRSLLLGGYLYIATPNLCAWTATSLWRSNLGGISGTDHRILYSPQSLSHLLQMNGFEISYCKTKTRFSRMLEETLMNIYLRSNLRTNPSINKKKHNRRPNNKHILSPLIFRVKKAYRVLINSKIVDFLFFVPNVISQMNKRGEELIILAKKVEE